jgi:hypothetical protein
MALLLVIPMPRILWLSSLRNSDTGLLLAVLRVCLSCQTPLCGSWWRVSALCRLVSMRDLAKLLVIYCFTRFPFLPKATEAACQFS